MNKELILRIKCAQGQYRITVLKNNSFDQLLLEISKKLNYQIRDITITNQFNQIINIDGNKRLSQLPFQNGTLLNVSSKNPPKKQIHGVGVSKINSNITSKCSHGPNGSCFNCTQSVDGITNKKCNHGPNGKCFNCSDNKIPNEQLKMKWMCQHGPNAKCCHCLDKEFISDVAHVSFDHFLQQKKLKCKGVHPSTAKCINCLPPSNIQYEVDRNCKNHQPYPKAMCNKCLPPNVVIKRQQYRHVDYVQFMNIGQIQDFVKYWIHNLGMNQQRVGYLYGYYAEDPNYKGGIRVIVEAIYQPEQKGQFSDFQILEKQQNIDKVQMVVSGLTLQRVGWIFTEGTTDCIISEKHTRMAAQMQQYYNVAHDSGYMISNYITVILRANQNNKGQVKPEVYMMSDQCQAIERSGLFVESDNRKLMKVKVDKEGKGIYPTFISVGKMVTSFQPQFLLVKIAHGASPNNKFAILKKSEFPPLSRGKPPKNFLKEYLIKNRNKSPYQKFGDFNFLLYLAKYMDIHTAVSLTEVVVKQDSTSPKPANIEALQQLIEQMVQIWDA